MEDTYTKLQRKAQILRQLLNISADRASRESWLRQYNQLSDKLLAYIPAASNQDAVSQGLTYSLAQYLSPDEVKEAIYYNIQAVEYTPAGKGELNAILTFDNNQHARDFARSLGLSSGQYGNQFTFIVKLLYKDI